MPAWTYLLLIAAAVAITAAVIGVDAWRHRRERATDDTWDTFASGRWFK